MRPNIRNKSNIVLQRSEVGRAKPGVGNLPPEEFVYGHPRMKDECDGKTVIFTWALSSKTPQAMMPADFKKINRFALPRKISNIKVSLNF